MQPPSFNPEALLSFELYVYDKVCIQKQHLIEAFLYGQLISFFSIPPIRWLVGIFQPTVHKECNVYVQ